MEVVFGTVTNITNNKKEYILNVYKRGKNKEQDIVYIVHEKIKNIKIEDRVAIIIIDEMHYWTIKNNLEVSFYIFMALNTLALVAGYSNIISVLSILNLFYLIEYHESYSDLNKLITKLIISVSYGIIILDILLMIIMYIIKP